MSITSRSNRSVTYSGSCTRVGQTQSLPIKCNKLIFSCISRLFVSCRPNTIILMISNRIIKTFEFVFRGRFCTHVRQKVDKIHSPQRINGYTLPTIISVTFTAWVCDAMYHSLPRAILACFSNSSAMTVPSTDFKSKTATRLRMPSSQVYTTHCNNVSTVTRTVPSSASVSRVFCSTQNGKFAEFFINHINTFNSHTRIITYATKGCQQWL